ncbi:Tripeptidyl-peptidase 1, partial [Egretta garzetta]
LVDAVSDPHSPRYGQYLSLERVRDLVQPSPATLMQVLKWLQGHGVENCRSVITLDFLECCMPARRVYPWGAWASPAPPLATVGLQSPCWRTGDRAAGDPAASELWFGLVMGTGQPSHQSHWQSGSLVPFPVMIPRMSCAASRSSQQSSRPGVPWLRSVGRAGAGGPSAPGASGAVEAWRPPCAVPCFPSSPVSQGELNLPCSVSAGRHESQEPFLAWLLLLSNMSSLPWVHSVSYGDDEDSLSLAYLERVNVEFMKAAARGLTILFASGDDGAGCRRVPGGNHTFRPSFPASSPYVTTVGGTTFKNPFLVTAEVTDYISGGGFSNVFPMPDYQVR